MCLSAQSVVLTAKGIKKVDSFIELITQITPNMTGKLLWHDMQLRWSITETNWKTKRVKKKHQIMREREFNSELNFYFFILYFSVRPIDSRTSLRKQTQTTTVQFKIWKKQPTKNSFYFHKVELHSLFQCIMNWWLRHNIYQVKISRKRRMQFNCTVTFCNWFYWWFECAMCKYVRIPISCQFRCVRSIQISNDRWKWKRIQLNSVVINWQTSLRVIIHIMCLICDRIYFMVCRALKRKMLIFMVLTIF